MEYRHHGRAAQRKARLYTKVTLTYNSPSASLPRLSASSIAMRNLSASLRNGLRSVEASTAPTPPGGHIRTNGRATTRLSSLAPTHARVRRARLAVAEHEDRARRDRLRGAKLTWVDRPGLDVPEDAALRTPHDGRGCVFGLLRLRDLRSSALASPLLILPPLPSTGRSVPRSAARSVRRLLPARRARLHKLAAAALAARHSPGRLARWHRAAPCRLRPQRFA